LLIAILVANLFFFGYFMFNDSRDATDTGQAVNELARDPVPPPVREQAVVVEAPAPVAPIEPATPIVAIAKPASEPEAREPVADLPQPAVTSEPDPQDDLEQTSLPSLQQLKMSGQVSLPPLHVDIHVYAGQPSKRFIFINMTKYREGDNLSEGPVVERITATGVILSHQGNRFTLNGE
jgi:general secretion pathway protein B